MIIEKQVDFMWNDPIISLSGSDGCLEEFDNTAAFSRDYQGRQNCLCDEEHMFSCPPGHKKPGEYSVSDQELEFSQALDQLLEKAVRLVKSEKADGIFDFLKLFSPAPTGNLH